LIKKEFLSNLYKSQDLIQFWSPVERIRRMSMSLNVVTSSKMKILIIFIIMVKSNTMGRVIFARSSLFS